MGAQTRSKAQDEEKNHGKEDTKSKTSHAISGWMLFCAFLVPIILGDVVRAILVGEYTPYCVKFISKSMSKIRIESKPTSEIEGSEKIVFSRNMMFIPKLPDVSNITPENKVKEGNEMLAWATKPIDEGGLGVVHFFEAAYYNYSSVGGPEKLLGVKATKDFSGNGEVVVKVPFHSLLSWHIIENDPLLNAAIGINSKAYKATKELLAPIPSGDYYNFDKCMYAVALLHQYNLGEKSKFHAYLSYISDTNLGGVPIFMTDEEIDKNYPPDLFITMKETVKAERAIFAAFISDILGPLSEDFPEIFGKGILHKGEPILSRNNFFWAVQMMGSRLWTPQFEDFPYPLVLSKPNDDFYHATPIAALMNYDPREGCLECKGEYEGLPYHTIPSNTATPSSKVDYRHSSASEAYFVCRATCPVKKGEEIIYHYFDYCEENFSLLYGFAPPGSENCGEIRERENRVPQLPAVSSASYEEQIKYGNEMLELWTNSFEEGGLDSIHSSITLDFFDYSHVGGPKKMKGVKSTRDIESGEVILKMPFHSLITWYYVVNDPVLQAAIGKGSKAYNVTVTFLDEGSPESKISSDIEEWLLPIVILYHIGLGEKSKFHRYMKVVANTDMSRFPMFMTDEEMDEAYDPVKFPDLKDEVKSDRQIIAIFEGDVLAPLRKDYPDIFGEHILYKGRPLLSLDNFHWAERIFVSRNRAGSFHSRNVGRKGGRLHHLAPFADMLNYGNKDCVSCTGEGFQKPMFVCSTDCPIKAGEEILFWYSDECRSTFPIKYGFVGTHETPDC